MSTCFDMAFSVKKWLLHWISGHLQKQANKQASAQWFCKKKLVSITCFKNMRRIVHWKFTFINQNELDLFVCWFPRVSSKFKNCLFLFFNFLKLLFDFFQHSIFSVATEFFFLSSCKITIDFIILDMFYYWNNNFKIKHHFVSNKSTETGFEQNPHLKITWDTEVRIVETFEIPSRRI